MAEGFEAEVLAALRELTEGQHRIEAALGMVRADVNALVAEVADIRDELLVTTTITASAEDRADATRALLRTVVKAQQGMGRRLAELERRSGGGGPGAADRGGRRRRDGVGNGAVMEPGEWMTLSAAASRLGWARA